IGTELIRADRLVKGYGSANKTLNATFGTFKKEDPTFIESLNDLKSEVCSEKPEADPTEATNVKARPLKNEDVTVSESVRDLKIELCSARLDAELSEEVRLLAKPLLAEPETPCASLNAL